MKVFLRVVSVAMWLVAAFLIYAVVHALGSAGGARVGVAVGYIAGAIILTAVGVWMWRWRSNDKGKPVAAA